MRPIPLRTLRGSMVVMAAVAITACGQVDGPRAMRWEGTTTTGAASQPLTVEVVAHRGAWEGTYTIGGTPPFTGILEADVVAGALTGTLRATPTCSFEIVGNVDEDVLEASYEPVACPGGAAGTWSAVPAPAGAPR